MSKKINEKRIVTLDSSFENILVCNDKSLRPYIETFYFEAENISQKKLGTLFGILEISDDSNDSSYIVNYLISVIRKEYFSKPKRGAVESLEASLHRANLALSKLAEHGSVAWLGKLNAIVAVIEKNNLHLSQAGRNSALLLRNKSLTDISEGLAGEDIEPNPLKTFENVTSGRLEDNDKLIIATETLFDIFSFEEIKKSALHFSTAELTQFIRTALSNEVPKAAALIISMQEKEEIQEKAPAKEAVEVNVFSQAAFSKKPSLPKVEDHDLPIEEEETVEISKQKNGHLYIKESEISSTNAQRSSSFEFFSSFQEKIRTFRPNLKPGVLPVRNYVSGLNFKKYTTILLELFSHAFFAVWNGLKTFTIFLWKLLQIGYYKIKEKYENRRREKMSSETISQLQDELKPKKSIFHRILPDFSKIKNVSSRFTLKQKISAGIIVALIIIVPYFINKTIRFYEAKKELARIQSIVPPPPLPLVDDRNVTRLENVTSVFETPDITKVINLNDSFLAITNDKIFDLESKESFVIPTELEKIDLAVPMEDLKILLLMNTVNRKIFTFSPSAKKFQTNNLPLPTNADITVGETYLTYLYLVDKNTNQIYRYPRAEGGFGEKADWKKDTADIQNTSAMAINENVFLTDGKNIQKFFRGQKLDFAIENTATSILPEKIWTKRDNENLYILDTTNSRIVKLDKDGLIISQYYHPEITNAIDFVVSEPKNQIVFSTQNSVKAFNLN